MRHDAKGYLASMPLPFPAARYHSLCVDASTLPPELVVSALADDGVVMGIRHKSLPIEGVQFHPESVLTPDGPRILARFLRRCGEGDAGDARVAARLLFQGHRGRPRHERAGSIGHRVAS